MKVDISKNLHKKSSKKCFLKKIKIKKKKK